jgi:hypothetical protein
MNDVIAEMPKKTDPTMFSIAMRHGVSPRRRHHGLPHTPFRDEFRPAFERWLASRPLGNPAAATTPFTLPEYQLEAVAEADRLESEAAAAGEEVKTDVARAEEYVLPVVLFATAIALTGIDARLRLFPIRAAVLAVGCAVFLGAVAWLATFPVDR